jgi:hypothetical protein
MPSASGVGRAMLCAASQVLPRVHRTSKYAHRGTVLHAYTGTALTAGRELALKAAPEEYRDICSRIDLPALKHLLGGHPKIEEAFVLDIREGTARYVGSNIGRNYGPLSDVEVAGTVDLLNVSGDAVAIADLKTGWQYVGPAAESWQMKTLALAVSRYFDKSVVHATLIRLREDGSLYESPTATFTAFELDEFLDELRDLYLRIESAKHQDIPSTYPGDEQCRYCDCVEHCPAHVQALVSAAGLIAADTEPRLAAPEVREWCKRAKKYIERIEGGIKQLATQEPIPLSNGKSLALVRVQERSIVAHKALPVIQDAMPEQAHIAVEMSCTQSSIKRAIREKAQTEDVNQSAMFDQVMRKLESRGAIETETVERVKEVSKGEAA